MIAVDTQLLVYAHREDAPWHEPALNCLRNLAESTRPWAIPWPCLHEFHAIVTHPRIYNPPSPKTRSLDQIEAWLESPSLQLLSESSTHWPSLRRLIDTGQVVGPMVHDARIAALCLQHRVSELWSADRDFSRFAGLTVRNPLLELHEGARPAYLGRPRGRPRRN